jgi:hypothetical protein
LALDLILFVAFVAVVFAAYYFLIELSEHVEILVGGESLQRVMNGTKIFIGADVLRVTCLLLYGTERLLSNDNIYHGVISNNVAVNAS